MAIPRRLRDSRHQPQPSGYTKVKKRSGDVAHPYLKCKLTLVHHLVERITAQTDMDGSVGIKRVVQQLRFLKLIAGILRMTKYDKRDFYQCNKWADSDTAGYGMEAGATDACVLASETISAGKA